MDILAQSFQEMSNGNSRMKRRPDLEVLAHNSYRQMFASLNITPIDIPRYVVCERPLLSEGTVLASKLHKGLDARRYTILISDEQENIKFTALHEAGHIFSFFTVPGIESVVIPDTNKKKGMFAHDQFLKFHEQFAECYAIAAMRHAKELVFPAHTDKAHEQFVDAPLEKLYAYLNKRLELLKNYA